MESSSNYAVSFDTSDSLGTAVAQACQDLKTRFQESIDLAFLFAAGYTPEEFDQYAPQARDLLNASNVIGCQCETGIAKAREFEGQKCLVVWVAHLPGCELLPMHLEYERSADGGAIVGWPEEISGSWPDPAKLIVIAEPFEFPTDGLLERFNEDRPGVEIVGGIASGALGPGQCRLLLNSQTFSRGAAVIRTTGTSYLHTLVSQGCRPIGEPMIVTHSERNLIYQLGGEPALVRLKKIFDALPTREQRMVETGLHLGRAINEYQEKFGYGDFLIRNIISLDGDTGAMMVADYVPVGQTVQFHIRDHETADAEMQQRVTTMVDHLQPKSAVLFTCNGRGTNMFPELHHDAELLSRGLATDQIAGFFAAGEIGPIGGKNFLHGFTASVAIFI
ncbi:MAG: FIST N-terminal domain-containing protein [Planctomycetota bacterium]|nr:FIST N-terminal domain-containing protein [Planctomycetota bacterium]